MIKSIKKIAFSILLSILAVLLCIFGSNLFGGKTTIEANAASATVTDVKIESDVTKVEAGGTINFTITITSGQSAGLIWKAVSLTINPFSSGTVAPQYVDYFELDTSFGTNGIDSNIMVYNSDEGYYEYDYYDNTCYKTVGDDEEKGFLISYASGDVDYGFPANTPIVVKYRLKVKSNAPDGIGDLEFKVASINANVVQYNNDVGTNKIEHRASSGGINCTSTTIKVGKESSDNTLKSLHVGATGATESVTIADSMNYVNAGTSTSFKFKAVVNDAKSTMKYCVGSGTPSTALTSGAETGITLDSSGETTVSILVTAEDKSTKTYTLTIKSSHARLSALAVNIGGSAVTSGMGMQSTFNGEKFTYPVKVPSDYTSFTVTPTILAGFGATGVDVAASGCTAAANVASGSALSVSDITNNASLTLTVTAKDGTTKQNYVLNFTVVNADTSIQSISVTESVTGTTVTNDPTKAASLGADYYFLLSEASGFKGKISINLTASTSSIKIGSANYVASTEYSADTYTATVTAEAGNTKQYKIILAKDLKPGRIDNLKYQIGTGFSNDVITDGDISYDAANNVYTLKKSFDPATYPANTVFKLTGTPNAGATVTPTGISGGSGTWSKNLTLGKNTFQLVATVAGAGSTTYKFEISLYEKKNTITSMTLKQGSNTISGFSFSTGDPSYTVNVPYKGYDTISIEAVTDGVYTVVKSEIGVATSTFTSAASSTSHTLASVSLTANAATTIKVYAVSDDNQKGTEYTIVINRAAADTEARLSDLTVTIDGTPITVFDNNVTFDPDTFTYTYTIEKNGSAATATIVLAGTKKSEKATVNGFGTKTFTFGSTTKTEPYTITVTPESGNADKKEYKINIKRVVKGGDFTDMEVSTDGANYSSIFASFDPTLHTQTIVYNVADVAVGTQFRVKPTLNTLDATVSQLTGLVKSGDVYIGTLSKFGDNTFKLSATSAAGSTAYTITVSIIEDKHDISNIVILDSKGTALSASDFTFNVYQDTYNIPLPFTVSSLTVKVTPDGTYNVVCETGDKKLTKNGTTYEKKVTLTAGATTTLVVYGVANNGTGLSTDPTAKGTPYTFNFERAQADQDTTLSQLTVKINGTEQQYKDVINFDPNINDYVIEIEKTGSANTANVEITAVPTKTSSDVKCDNVLMTTTKVTKTFTFLNNVEHETKYTFVVEAESGSKNTYTVTIKRIIIPGDFTELEFAESGSSFEDVFTSIRYDQYDKKYTVDLSTDTVSEGSSIRIKAVPTSGATVSVTGSLITSSTNLYSGKLVHGENTFTLTAKTSTGTSTYTFVVNLYENKKTIERVTITSDGSPLSSDLFTFSQTKTTYPITVPYTVNSLKMTVATDGVYTTVIDELGNAFAKTSTAGRNHERTINLDAGKVTTLLIRGKSDKGEESEWYTFEITRENANSDPSLKALSVTIGGKAVPFTEGAFNPDRTDYTILVDEASSYTVNIKATANATTSKVTGDGTQPPFTFSDSTSTQTYPIEVTAEDGSTRTYRITISQKPIVLDSNYDLTRIVINGSKDYYDDVPAFYNDPVKISVPYSESRVKVVVTAATTKAQVVIDPALTKQGYLALPEGETTTLKIYAVAEDGTNAGGEDAYLFEITRLPLGEVVGDDTEIYIDDEEMTSFVLDSSEDVLLMLDAYTYKKDKLKLQVDLVYGGTYEVKRIEKDGTTTIVSETDVGKFKNVPLKFGINILSVDIVSSDGNSRKSALFIVERGEPTLEEISALEISSLKKDFNRDPYKDEYSYSVDASVDKLTLDVEVDKTLFTYDVEGADKLEYGLNKVVITIYEKNDGRAMAEAVRTITLNVYRENNNFWFIMFWVMLALTLVMLVIVIILWVRKNRNNNNDDGDMEYIYSNPVVEPSNNQSTPPIILIPPQA